MGAKSTVMQISFVMRIFLFFLIFLLILLIVFGPNFRGSKSPYEEGQLPQDKVSCKCILIEPVNVLLILVLMP